jgi:hypothetical protein
MHSTKGPSGQWYAHNGDFSGEVKVSLPVRPQGDYGLNYPCASEPHQIAGQQGHFVEVEIPFADIRALYLRYLTSKQISRLEQASDDEREQMLLGIPEPASPQSGQAPAWVLEELKRRDMPGWRGGGE